MHRVLESHLNAFVEAREIKLPTDRAFEAFVAHCVAQNHTADSFDALEQIYDGDDPGIDSVMFVANDSIISSTDELEELFARKGRDVLVGVIFLQAKTSETWSKKDINTFAAAVLDFISTNPRYPMSDFLIERKKMFDIIIRNVGRVKHGKPDIACYFATSAPSPEDREIISAFQGSSDRLEAEGLFRMITFAAIDREDLIRLWMKSSSTIETTFRVFAHASFPKSPGIEESYVVTAKAHEFVERVLCDDNGNLRRSVFEENVRDFIGLASPVNSEINETIKSHITRSRFGILNNGITIVAPDVRLQSNEMYLSDYQIVNGCQTSNVLYENRENLSDETTVMVKVVEASDQTIVDEIVKSTNNQTKVDEHQFLATLESVKNIERYFKVKGSDEEHRLYFERRPHQYAGEGIAAIRIHDIRTVARCTGAMFFDRPELATRYPSQLTTELCDTVFGRKSQEEVFYCSAYTFYRLRLLIANNRIAQKFSKIKWFLLMAIKYKIAGDDIPDVTSPNTGPAVF